MIFYNVLKILLLATLLSPWFGFAAHRESQTAAAYTASASAMQPLIAKNREKLRNAQKTGDGAMAGFGSTGPFWVMQIWL